MFTTGDAAPPGPTAADALAPASPGAAGRRRYAGRCVAVLLPCALVAYVVVAAGGRPDEVATRPARAVGGVADDAAPVAPSPVPPRPVRPVRTPVPRISAPTTADLDRFIAGTGTRPEVVDTFESWSLGRPLVGPEDRPGIAGVVWFAHVDHSRGVDRRIGTDPGSAHAWREAFVSRPIIEQNGR